MKKKQVTLQIIKIKITDFGFAKRISAGLETDSVKCGTPETMSPELH
jgi:serine/threonine protein kinase